MLRESHQKRSLVKSSLEVLGSEIMAHVTGMVENETIRGRKGQSRRHEVNHTDEWSTHGVYRVRDTRCPRFLKQYNQYMEDIHDIRDSVLTKATAAMARVREKGMILVTFGSVGHCLPLYSWGMSILWCRLGVNDRRREVVLGGQEAIYHGCGEAGVVRMVFGRTTIRPSDTRDRVWIALLV